MSRSGGVSLLDDLEDLADHVESSDPCGSEPFLCSLFGTSSGGPSNGLSRSQLPCSPVQCPFHWQEQTCFPSRGTFRISNKRPSKELFR